MKIPLSWLKEYIDINLSPLQISKILTMAGLEVDATLHLSAGFEKVVVGKVLQTAKHPDADNLCIASVTDGTETFQVVCGAPNCRPGIKTAFAMEGATLTDEEGKTFKVKKSKLRGVESQGMLCSAKELQLSENHEGILEFSEHFKEGADVAEMYADVVFDISLTPNLGHCSYVIGVARELSAATGAPVRLPEIRVEQKTDDLIASQATVNVLNTASCPRYVCRLIKNVQVKPSPDWLQKRLTACGIRPVNNIVDITNYVLLEMGHPLHAFDFDQLHGKEILVKDVVEGEHFTTLDGKVRILQKHDLLICDKEKPVALAGIMGGQNSEVTDSTTNVLIEAAYFLPTVIRKTSKRLGLQTDASKRFERGADPNCLIAAADRAAMLIQQIAGGTVCSGIIDIASQTFAEKHVACRFSRINHLLGTHLSISEIESIFSRLQLPFHWNGNDLFTVKVPTSRVDIKEEVDLIEEVARIYGYDNIPQNPPKYHGSILPDAPIFLFEREVRSRMISEGLQEFLTCDLIGPSLLQVVKGDDISEESAVKVINPNSIEQSILRTSLLPGLLQVVKYNWDHQIHDVSGFEVGRIHFKENEQYTEQSVVGIMMSGKAAPHHWDVKPRDCDFYDLKGIIENMLKEFAIEGVSYKENHLDVFHPGRQAAINVGALEIGSMGEIHPSIVRRLDVPQRIYFAEINLHDVYKVKKPQRKMTEIPIYPGSERDLTLTLKDEVPIGHIFNLIAAVPSRLLEKVSLLDIYRSEKLGTGLKNATFRFHYRDLKKTIAQERVDAEHARIVEEVLKKQT